MCSRFGLISNIDEIFERYNLLVGDFKSCESLYGRENMYPSEMITVLLNGEIDKMSWGVKTSPDSKIIINSRIENIVGKKYFYDDFKNRRCIIPANYFYEWDKVNVENSKYKVYDKNCKIFSMAGIYRYLKDKDVVYKFVSILTKKAEGDISKIHSRMPIILNKDFEEEYLYENGDDIVNEIVGYKPNLKLELDSNNQISFI